MLLLRAIDIPLHSFCYCTSPIDHFSNTLDSLRESRLLHFVTHRISVFSKLNIAISPPSILFYPLLDWIWITDRQMELQNSCSFFANKEKIHNYHLYTMKYLEVPSLSVLSSKMNQVTQSDMKLNCRIELYSCESCMCEWIVGKMSTEQKKLSRKLRQDLLRDSEDAFVTISESTNILWTCRFDP